MRFYFMLVLIVVVLLVMTVCRNAVWHSPIALWQDVVSKNTNSALVHNNLGNCYAIAGRTLEAIEEYKIALTLNSYFIEAYYNLGSSLEDVGRSGEARYYYSVYCDYAPFGSRKVVACERAKMIRSE